MAYGDQIKVKRLLGYWHHGIDVGDGTVIHYTGERLQKLNAEIKRTSLESFLDGGVPVIVQYANCFAPEDTIEIALLCIGERDYSFYSNNCECFARWCKTGERVSEQVRNVAATLGVGLGTPGLTSGAIGTVSTAGVVSGLSGAGIMSGLATIGGVAGTGAVGGVLTLAAAPALLANTAISMMYKDDEYLDDNERAARKAARISAKVGTFAGAAGTVGTISAAGVAGLSGAGITSGLAAIGSFVGGGMVAGVAVAVAAPAVATAAAGFGIYTLWRKIKK